MCYFLESTISNDMKEYTPFSIFSIFLARIRRKILSKCSVEGHIIMMNTQKVMLDLPVTVALMEVSLRMMLPKNSHQTEWLSVGKNLKMEPDANHLQPNVTGGALDLEGLEQRGDHNPSFKAYNFLSLWKTAGVLSWASLKQL